MELPNWITENDWSLEQRMDFAKDIMVFSAQDWSTYPYATSGMPNDETWILWCLICCDTKAKATKAWKDFVTEQNPG